MRLMEQVQRMFSDRKTAAAASYAGLVKAIADGRPMPSKAVDIAIAAGKSMSDLEADAAMLARRIEADQQLQRAKKLAADHAAAVEAQQAKHHELEQLEARHKLELQTAQAAYNEAASHARSLNRERSMLTERATKVLTTTADPAISQRIQSLESERSRLQADCNDSGRMAAQAEQLPEPQREQRRQEIAEIVKANSERMNAIAEEIATLEQSKLDPANCAI